jgi:hypothetical protein
MPELRVWSRLSTIVAPSQSEFEREMLQLVTGIAVHEEDPGCDW